jgi:hypothetical protein
MSQQFIDRYAADHSSEYKSGFARPGVGLILISLALAVVIFGMYWYFLASRGLEGKTLTFLFFWFGSVMSLAVGDTLAVKAI